MTDQLLLPDEVTISEILRKVSNIPGTCAPQILKEELVKAGYAAGADAELDACVDWVEENEGIGSELRDHRRPGRSTAKRFGDALEQLRRDILRGSSGADGVGGPGWQELEALIEDLPNG